MWNYLRNLQQKPLHERKIATYILTVFFFIVIVFLWVMFLNVEKARESNTVSLGSILSPFQSVKDIFTSIFDGTQTVEFSGLNDILPEEFFNEGQLMEGGQMMPKDMGTTTETIATTTSTTTPVQREL